MQRAAQRLHQENLQLVAMYDNVRQYLVQLGFPEAEINQRLSPARTASELPMETRRALERTFQPRVFDWPAGMRPPSTQPGPISGSEAYMLGAVQGPQQTQSMANGANRPTAWNPEAAPFSMPHHGLPLATPSYFTPSHGQGGYQPPVAQPFSASVSPTDSDNQTTVTPAPQQATFQTQQPNSFPYTTAAVVQPMLAYSYDSSTFHSNLQGSNPPIIGNNVDSHHNVGPIQQNYNYDPSYQPRMQQATPQWQHAASGPLPAPLQPPAQPYLQSPPSSAPPTFPNTGPFNPR